MTYLSRVTRNTLVLFGNRVLLTAANFAVGILVVRYLGAEQFGVYTVVFAFLSFFSAFAGSSGVDHILVREVSRGLDDDSKRRKIASAIALRLGLGGFGALLAIAGSLLLYGSRPETAYIAASAISLLLSFHDTNSPLIVQYNARLELFVPQVIGTVIFLAIAAVKLFLVFAIRPGVLPFILLDAATPVAISVAYWLLYRTSGGTLRRRDISVEEAWSLAREASPIFFGSIFVMAYMKIDQILIARWLGSGSLGNYGVAVRIAEVFHIVPVYLSVSLLPVFAQTLTRTDRDDIYALSFRSLNLYIFPVILFFHLFSTETIALLFPGQFPMAPGAIRVLIWSDFFVCMGCIHSTAILASGLQRYNLILLAVQASANLLLNWILIPSLSIVGASWASVASHGLGLAASLCVPEVRRFTVILLRNSAIFLAVSGATIVLSLVLPGTPRIPLCIAGVALLLFLGIRRRDIAILKSIAGELKTLARGG